jgi:GT2 family glycosyltransferase
MTSIIIVNYNSTEFLLQCLKSIAENSKDVKTEVIVVDNNSPQRDIESFPERFPNVKFIFSHSNEGFGAGCNKGASAANGEYLLFLNPDTIMPERALAQLVEFMGKEDSAGACAPVYEDFKGKLVYTYNKFPNIRWEFNEFLGKGNEKVEASLLSDKRIINRSNEQMKVDWLTGACLLVRRNLFNEIGCFDEDYFLYYEDTDLQKRISERGIGIFCIPKVRIKHFVNSSVFEDKGRTVYHFHINRSKMLYYYKNEGFIKRNTVRILMIAGILLRTVTLPFRKRFESIRREKFRQYLYLLKIYSLTKKNLIAYRFPN